MMGSGSVGVEEGKKKRKRQRAEDILDVSIAYLRRVHLFTFYNGCHASDNVGSVLSGDHPAGTIHLRLRGADDILKKTKEEHADMYGDLPMGNNTNGDRDMNGDESKSKEDGDGGEGVDNAVQRQQQGEENDESTHASSDAKDMLVMRLDTNITRALGVTTTANVTPHIVNEPVDAMADEIEIMEEKNKKEWVDNHAVIDSDGRARCSFHFCRKLFKDKNFLQKHLLKKHPEFLHGETAKCHDSYMMKWWDGEVKRPVPQILVDCGSRFGSVPSSVQGATEPRANDPEPDLWREEQIRIQRRHDGGGGGGGSGGPRGGSDFVDVDDMKDEKVELSFDNIVPVVPKKKKKKKKRKLL